MFTNSEGCKVMETSVFPPFICKCGNIRLGDITKHYTIFDLKAFLAFKSLSSVSIIVIPIQKFRNANFRPQIQ